MVCLRDAFLPPVRHTGYPLGFCPPQFYKHIPAIAGVAVSEESTCLADLLSQEPQFWNLVLPNVVQNASEVAQVESVEFVLIPCVQGLTSFPIIQKCLQHAGPVDLNFTG